MLQVRERLAAFTKAEVALKEALAEVQMSCNAMFIGACLFHFHFLCVFQLKTEREAAVKERKHVASLKLAVMQEQKEVERQRQALHLDRQAFQDEKRQLTEAQEQLENDRREFQNYKESGGYNGGSGGDYDSSMPRLQPLPSSPGSHGYDY